MMEIVTLVAVIFACFGGLLFGYDIGIIGGVLVMKPFHKEFNLTDENSAELSGNIVSLLQAGCFFGALSVQLIADTLGRKLSILISALVFVIGGLLQTIASTNLGLIYSGRLIAGIGLGAVSMLVPMYVAEIARKENRGRLGCLWQLFIVIGIAISYWTNYIVIRHIPETENLQWRIPLGLQMVPGVLLFLGMIFMPRSPRWLCSQDRIDDARKSLAKLRHSLPDDPAILAEIDMIRESIEEERKTASSWREIFMVRVNRRRLIVGLLLQSFQQFTGTNVINYYTPTILKSIGLDSTETDLLATGLYGMVKILITFICIAFLIEPVGRKPLLWSGALIMMASMFIVGTSVKFANLNPETTGTISAAGYVGIAGVYLFAFGYSYSWGPIVWVLTSEIFPNRIRAKCVSLTTAINWFFNAIIGRFSPILLKKIGFGLYYIFGSFAVLMFLFTVFFVPETKGRSLEEMDELFGSHSEQIQQVLEEGSGKPVSVAK
ncbi:uncharacterized protein VTP21DRAFT_9014 [Calcarisporiella thermophila]|uniref:uncharacterized protein n=1 Tax=Calcarisporiella thermophila TaxID=911321 RepID=UPI0037424776